MFKTANPYDEPVTKATDENLTSEDWEANLDVCDKVSGEGEQGARNCIAAIQKRLAHRSANVQLHALILTDALSKNAGVNAHREIASRSFSQTLVRLATDRNTHDSVKRKAYSLVKEWTREYGTDPDLGIIQETYTALQKQLGHRFDEVAEEAAPEEPSTDELRREDEELRRVLELSMRDQGGRQHWASQYGVDGGAAGASGSSSGAGGAGAASASNAAPASGSSRPAAAASSSSAAPLMAASASASASRPGPSAPGFAPANAQSATPAAPPAAAPVAAHLPARAPAVNVPATVPSISVIGASPATPVGAQPTAHSAAAAVASTRASGAAAAPEAAPAATPTVSRVRALYDFKASEQGELGFTKGDIIRVLYAVYDHWWRGELRGDVGIFPVNYVEILPDPTPADLQKEAEMEARVFDQAASIDSLLNKLKELDPARDNLADDEELQELYQVSLSMRPKIIRLIDRYSAKISELKAMNDKFVRARGTFDRLMEESLAKYNPGVQSAAYTQVRPEYTGAAVNGGAPGAEHQQQQQQQQYGYNNYLAQQQQQQQQHPQLQQLQHQPQPQPQPAHLQGQQQPPAMQAQSVPPQQQQDYARAWAEWYAQNGYPEQAAQAAAAAAAAAAAVVGQQGGGGASAPAPSAVPAGPAGPITPFSGAGMAVPAPATAAAPAMLPPAGAPAAGGSSGSVALSQAPAVQAPAASPGLTTSAPLPTPSGSGGGAGAADDVPRDVEKLRLYERARAETEAYQRQGGVVDPYGVYAGAGAGASGSGSGSGAEASGSGSGAMASSSSAAAGSAAGPSQGSLV